MVETVDGGGDNVIFWFLDWLFFQVTFGLSHGLDYMKTFDYIKSKISAPVKNIQHLSHGSFSNSEKEECIDAKLALVDESGEPVQWDESFRDIGSAQARQWNEKFAAALPELHFISNNIICFVEVGAIKYTEFNDQVIMESRLTIMSSQGRKISSSQIKSYVHEIIDKIKILADPEFANRVTSKFLLKPQNYWIIERPCVCVSWCFCPVNCIRFGFWWYFVPHLLQLDYN